MSRIALSVLSSSTSNRSTVTEFDGMRPSGTRSDFEQSSTTARTDPSSLRTRCRLPATYGSPITCFRRCQLSVHGATCMVIQYQVRTNNVYSPPLFERPFPDVSVSADFPSFVRLKEESHFSSTSKFLIPI